MARLIRRLRQPRTDVVPLDPVDATTVVGWLTANDVADAHIVACARRSRTGVVTSDPENRRRLDPDAARTPI